MSECPCCGQRIVKARDLTFGPIGCAVTRNGTSVRLSPTQYRIIFILRDRLLSMRDLIDAVYADDPDGGPDNAKNTLLVTEANMNKRLLPLGIRVGADRRGNQAALHGIFDA